jgi:hypothetical protein
VAQRPTIEMAQAHLDMLPNGVEASSFQKVNVEDLAKGGGVARKA